MTSLMRTGCAAVLLAAGLVPALGSQAHAESLTLADETGDAYATVGSLTQTMSEVAPNEKRVDITSVDFDYATRFLYVRIEVAQLRTTGGQPDPFVRVKGGGVDWTFIRGARPGKLVKFSPSTGTSPCKNASLKVTPRDSSFRLTIPARCFGTPDTVRLGAAVYRPSASNPKKRYGDDVRATNGYNESRGNVRPILGNPNLARG